MTENILADSVPEIKVNVDSTNRSFGIYRVMLFPESYAGNKVKKFLMEKRYLWPEYEGFSWSSFDHYEKKGDELLTLSSFNLKQLNKQFGGEKEFFKPGSIILDIGSGVGGAVEDISKHYPKVKTVGLDLRYGKEKAAGRRGVHIKGSWEALPFADNSFNRILAYESFPAWGFQKSSSFSQDIKTIKEATRVSQSGTIWRSTIAAGSKIAGSREAILSGMIENGWDVYCHSRWPALMVAQLKNK